jgi:diaminopimelate decarboxylase
MSQQLSPGFLIQLAEEFGTPLYVYHAEKIKEQYEKLQSALKIVMRDFSMRVRR